MAVEEDHDTGREHVFSKIGTGGPVGFDPPLLRVTASGSLDSC